MTGYTCRHLLTRETSPEVSLFLLRPARVFVAAFLVGMLGCLSLAVQPAIAQWVEGGFPVVRGYSQAFAQVADGMGGSILIWTPYRGDSNWDVEALHLTGDGMLDPHWPAEGVALCSSEGAQLFPGAVSDDSGGAFTVWLDDRGRDRFAPYAIYANRVNGDGTLAAGNWPADGLAVCADSCTEVEPVLAADGAGGAYIGWSEPGPDGGIRLQHVLRDGSISGGWPPEGLAVCRATGSKVVRKAVPDGTGGVYISWDDSRDGGFKPYVQRIESGGTVSGGWPADGLRFGDSGIAVVGSTICSDGAGGVVAFWREGGDGPGFTWSMRSKRIASDGSQTAGWASPATSTTAASSGETARCACANDGGAFVAWSVNQSEYLYPAYVQKIAADGSKAPGWPDGGLALSTTGYNSTPCIAVDGAGGAYCAWTNSAGSPPEQVMIEHVMQEGSLAAGWVQGGIAISEGNSAFPSIVATGNGASIILWATIDAIYAQRVVSTGVDYISFAVVSTQLDPDRARLLWQASTAWTTPLMVYRRDHNGWHPLRVVAADASGKVIFDDLEVVAGGHYTYRLGAFVHGREMFFGEIDVQVPPFALTVRPFRGNPSRKTVELAVTLPANEAAKLQLFDLQGRLVESREVGQMGLGRHTVVLGSEKRVTSGIYLVLLSQGGKTASAKVALLR